MLKARHLCCWAVEICSQVNALLANVCTLHYIHTQCYVAARPCNGYMLQCAVGGMQLGMCGNGGVRECVQHAYRLGHRCSAAACMPLTDTKYSSFYCVCVVCLVHCIIA